MKRPQSILGLLITLVGIHAARFTGWRRLAAIAVVGAVGLSAVHAWSPCGHAARQQPSHSLLSSDALPAPFGALVRDCTRAHSTHRFADCVARFGVTPSIAGTLAADKPIALNPVLAWNGDGYGVAWVTLDVDAESFGLRFARVDRTGKRVGSVTRIVEAAPLAFAPDLVWTGSEYGLTWTMGDGPLITVAFARIGANGARIGNQVRVPDAPRAEFASRIVWNGREYALVWYAVAGRESLDMRFRRLARVGDRLGTERSIQRGLGTGLAGFAWNGDGYGLAWNGLDIGTNRATLRFLPLGADGAPGRALDVSVNDGMNGGAVMAWTGAAFGMAWEENIDSELNNTLSFASAIATEVPVRRAPITDGTHISRQPVLAWNGAEYGLAWTDDRNGGISVQFARVARDGRVSGVPARLTERGQSVFPALTWTGNEFGCAWADTRDGGLEIFFARLAPDGRKIAVESRISE